MLNTNASVELLNAKYRINMLETLGLEYTGIGEDYISAKIPVDHRTMQPFNILHGGASVFLAETLGSMGSALSVDLEKKVCVGLEVNANHIRPVTSGFIHGTAKAKHLGRKTHIWEIEITDDNNKLVCLSRLTVAIIDKP